MKADPTPTQRAIIDEICALISVGDSLRQACKKMREKLPGVAPAGASNFLNWIEGHTDLEERYAQARAECLEFRFEELQQMAQDSKAAKTKEEAAGWRNEIDVRKWQLSKMAPQRYGDRVALTGPDGGPVNSTPVVVQIAGMDPIAASRAYQDFVNGSGSKT